MLGNEAIARGAFEAGVGVVSSYPGTPSTEITQYVSTYDEIYSEWAPNEKVSLEVAVGASFAGARALCAMKHVGLNVASDVLFTTSYSGINGGLCICVADDPGMHSSQDEQDSRHYARASKVPMLEPSDSDECKNFVVKGMEISEEYDTPVLIRLSTRISHGRSLVETNDPIKRSGKFTPNPEKYVMMPLYARAKHPLVEKRIKNLINFSEKTNLNKIEYNDKKIGVICAGTSYNYSKEALGDTVSYLKLGMVYPLPEKIIREFASNVETCFVIEELDPFIEEHCLKLGIKVVGKEKLTLIGEYTPEMIKAAVTGIPEENSAYALPEAIPGRPPVMCAGCSHRAAFTAIKQLGLNVHGDIGCYTLSAAPVLSAMYAQICMGASIGMAHGAEKAAPYLSEPLPKSVAVIGDSTFVHNGITGLIDAVYNKGTCTVVILDNSTTGMTGHQDHPGTGKTIKGEPTHKLDLFALCKACGVNRVTKVDPHDLEKFKAILMEEVDAKEVSVIIAERPCALLKTTVHGTKKTIDKNKCKNCMLCMKIGCPAIGKRGDEISIDAAICVGCEYCGVICKFDAIANV